MQIEQAFIGLLQAATIPLPTDGRPVTPISNYEWVIYILRYASFLVIPLAIVFSIFFIRQLSQKKTKHEHARARAGLIGAGVLIFMSILAWLLPRY